MQGFFVVARTAVVTRLAPLQARLQRTTPRERLLLLVLVLGVLVYAPVAAVGWRADQEDRYIDAMTERSAARLARDSARRIVAGAGDQAAVDDMRGWGFTAANTPVAQVQIEQKLVAAAEDAGLTQSRITTDTEVETIGPVQWLGAEIEADLRWASTFAFLDALTGWPEGFRVTRFQYELRPAGQGYFAPDVQQPLGKVRIGLAFPVEVADTSDGEGG